MTIKKEREKAIGLLEECYKTIEGKNKDGSDYDLLHLQVKLQDFFREIEESQRKQRKLLCFILTMPNVGSWNGKWSGEKDLHAVIRPKGRNKLVPEILYKRNYHYSWNDGWGANIEVKEVNSSEATKIRKKSQGFCGYEWMVESLLRYGEIRNIGD